MKKITVEEIIEKLEKRIGKQESINDYIPKFFNKFVDYHFEIIPASDNAFYNENIYELGIIENREGVMVLMRDIDPLTEKLQGKELADLLDNVIYEYYSVVFLSYLIMNNQRNSLDKILLLNEFLSVLIYRNTHSINREFNIDKIMKHYSNPEFENTGEEIIEEIYELYQELINV